MRIITILLLSFVAGAACASDIKYPVSEIPESLKTNANAVVREDHMSFTITSQHSAKYHVLQAITILNNNAKRFATHRVDYDKFLKITSFKASVYDGAGNLVKKLKSSEITDQSAYDGFSIYSDNRYKEAELLQNVYPYTVEFEYEVEYKFLFFIPGSYIISAEKVAVQNASYELIYPKALKPRYRVYNTDVKPVIQPNGTDESIKWTFQNLAAIRYEPYGPALENILPHIIAAPSQFEYDGYAGTMDTWDQFGKWMGSLNKGRDVLPEATKAKMIEITASAKTPEEKVKRIYEYVQNKTRYVSIQLGIGGHQPFEASLVDKTGYGDCKALSNYMVSLLKCVGIKANYVLIESGDDADPMKTDFPSSQFNHVVVAVPAVPAAKDTLWLECTSQTVPFGYMGRFTGDRKALMITDNGAKVVSTPRYELQKNTQMRRADVVIDKSGNASAKVTTTYRGLQYENGGLDYVVSVSYDEQKKWVQKNTGIPSFDLVDFSMQNIKEKIPTAIVKASYSLPRLASVSGKRLFLTPNLMNRNNYVPEKLEARKTKVTLDFAYLDVDTIAYQVPEDIYPEFMPQPAKITSRFGEYESSFKMDQGKVLYIRSLRMNKGEYPAESYTELIDFYKSVSKADNIKMVFLSKT